MVLSNMCGIAGFWQTKRGFEHPLGILKQMGKVDRVSMAVSLGARVPILDHRVVEFAWKLPLHFKIRNGTGKWAFRQVHYKHVPRHLIERPKMGFRVPIDGWLRGPLLEWAQDLLSTENLKYHSFFQAGIIRQKWTEHLSGGRNWQYLRWNVLAFQDWFAQHERFTPARFAGRRS